jgi:hypothetical protein
MSTETSTLRKLFMVLSPRSLPYARLALTSLYRTCADDFSLSLVTDSQDDVASLNGELARLADESYSAKRRAVVFGNADLSEVEQDRFGKFQNIQIFRRGHPCWRKITDPILLSDGNDEMILLDPDLYFPNRFCFEPTPSAGLLLMWQRPSCLLPEQVVEAAFEAHVPLAHHTDIGVAQWRLPVDLDWLDWLIGRLGSSRLPQSMHVESIVWAALAMRMGGGHLDPNRWVCWHRSQYKRISMKLGTSGPSLLKNEPFANAKCFHAGGEAKWWLADAYNLGFLDYNNDVAFLTDLWPYRELTPSKYYSMQRTRRWLRKLGYYVILDS